MQPEIDSRRNPHLIVLIELPAEFHREG